jgi:alanine racemase
VSRVPRPEEASPDEASPVSRVPRPDFSVPRPDSDSIREGDEVIIFGDNHPVAEMAQATGTIPYEVLTGISRWVKRIY